MSAALAAAPMSPTMFPIKEFSLSGLTSMMASLDCRISSARWSFTLDMSPARKGGSTLQHKPRHQLDMRGVAELIDRRDALYFIAAIDQNSRVACKGGDVARYRDHHWNLAGGELLGLRLRALPRRIEHHGFVVAQLLPPQRTPQQVTRLGLDPLPA